MTQTEDDTKARRQRLVTAVVALVEHAGNMAPAQSFETDRLAIEVFEAANITHEEFQAAHAELEARTILKSDRH